MVVLWLKSSCNAFTKASPTQACCSHNDDLKDLSKLQIAELEQQLTGNPSSEACHLTSTAAQQVIAHLCKTAGDLQCIDLSSRMLAPVVILGIGYSQAIDWKPCLRHQSPYVERMDLHGPAQMSLRTCHQPVQWLTEQPGAAEHSMQYYMFLLLQCCSERL